MAQVMKDIVTWLKQWFYTETEVDTITGGLQTQINNKADSSTVSSLATAVDGKADESHEHGNITTDGKVGTTANKPLITTTGGKVTTGSFGTVANTFCQGNDSRLSDAREPTAHNQASSTITEASALTNIGTNANATQHDINVAVDTKLATFVTLDWIRIETTLPTASESTMGKLYLIPKTGASGTNIFKEYVTVKQSTTYSWEELGELSGSEVSINWSTIEGKPSTFPPSSHTHDDRYYTETEVDTALAAKSAKNETININNITLVDKGETNEGCMIFNTIS